MKYFHFMIAILLIATLSTSAAYSAQNQKEKNSYNIVVAEKPEATNITINVDDIILKEDENFQKIEFRGAGKTAEIGLPDLPIISKFVAIPNDASVELNIIDVEKNVRENVRIKPVQPEADDINYQRGMNLDADFYNSDQLYPYNLATISDPMILRDFRIVQLNVYPFRYNPAKKKLTEVKSIEIELKYGNEPTENVKYSQRNTVARSFDKIYRKMIVNYDEVLGDRFPADGSMLIISHDMFMDAMVPLAEWKTQKGIPTELVPLSEIGQNPTQMQIKGYIYNHYMNSDPQLEHVILVGDVTMPGEQTFPCFTTINENATDHLYAELEGNDYLPEIHIGRFAVDYLTEAIVIADKIINYESNPSTANPDWFKSALMVGARYTYQGIPVTSPREMKRWVHQELLNYGYTHVDTIYYPEINNGEAAINAAVNSGVSLINYRGWAGPASWYYPIYNIPTIANLENGYMLPLVTSIVCGTGRFNSTSDPCFGEAWLRAGSPGEPAGAIAFYGASEVETHTAWNNTLDGGIYTSLLHNGMNNLGTILDAGEIGLMTYFPDKADFDCSGEDCVKFMCHVYNLLGDPSLNLWTDSPKAIDVTYQEEIPMGQNFYEVSITHNGSPVPDALVCVMKDDEIYSYARTNSAGTIALPINSEATPGQMSLTITKVNHQPFMTDIEITEQSYIGYENHTLQNAVNPDETVGLSVSLKNFGAESANNVTATLSVDDPYVSVTHSTVNYGTINAGQTVTPDDNFEIHIDPTIPHNYPIRLDLIATDGNGDESMSHINLMSEAVQMTFNEYAWMNTSPWMPGDTKHLYVTLENTGAMDGETLTATLITYFDGVTIGDANGSFGNIMVGETGNNLDDAFEVTANSEVYEGIDVKFLLELTDGNGYQETLSFFVPIGEPSPTNPLGPDSHGYYAFDSHDTDYDEAPTYQWIEIDPEYGGSGTGLNLIDDGAAILDLPFSFQYYGQTFDQITINANGWISMGEADWHYFLMENAYNYYIGCPMNPDGVVAPYWDNLNFPEEDGDIYYYHDAANHRFIVQWSRLGRKIDLEEPEFYVTFQAILYDPAYNETLTGDGEIVFQYHTIPEADECTIGIGNLENSDGLQYLYNTYYAASASTITNELAIKFTTDTMFPTDIETENINSPKRIELAQNYPNPFNPNTTIRYTLNRTADVKLAIYDVSGKLIRTLVDAEKDAGFYSVNWNGEDDSGKNVGSGIYLYRLESDNFEQTKRMILIR
jgi:hypothetical protein